MRVLGSIIEKAERRILGERYEVTEDEREALSELMAWVEKMAEEKFQKLMRENFSAETPEGTVGTE